MWDGADGTRGRSPLGFSGRSFPLPRGRGGPDTAFGTNALAPVPYSSGAPVASGGAAGAPGLHSGTVRADRGAAGLTGVLAWLATRGGTRPWSNPSPEGVALSASSIDPCMSLADAVVGPVELTAAELAAVGHSNAEAVKAARNAAAWRPAPGDLAPWLGISFGTPLRLSHFSLSPTSVVGDLMLLASADNKRWHELAIREDGPVFVDGVANVSPATVRAWLPPSAVAAVR